MLLSRIFFILTINKWQLALQHGIDGFKVMVIFLSCLEKQQRTKALSKRVIRRMAFHYLDRKPSEASWSTGFCTVPLCAVSFLGWSGQRAPPRFWNSWLDFPTASQQWLPAGNELSCPLATRWADTGCPNEGVTRNAALFGCQRTHLPHAAAQAFACLDAGNLSRAPVAGIGTYFSCSVSGGKPEVSAICFLFFIGSFLNICLVKGAPLLSFNWTTWPVSLLYFAIVPFNSRVDADR